MKNYLYKPKHSTFLDKITNAPLNVKLVGGGSLLAFIGCFLPWFSKEFGSRGVTYFNGLQDMTYLVGYIVLVLSLFSFVLSLYHVFDWKMFKMPVKENYIHIFSAIEIILLGIVAFSIYNSAYEFFSSSIDTKFGISVTMIGGAILFFGGYLGLEDDKRQEAHKTFIHLPEEEENPLHELLDKEEKSEEEPPQERMF